MENIYFKKYLKYKNKYHKLKNSQSGGETYNNLVYVGQGASSIAYGFSDKKELLLKITKDSKKFMNQNELDVIEKIKKIDQRSVLKKHFPIYHAIGKCRNLEEPKVDSTKFCIDGIKGKEYEYVVMNRIHGRDIKQIFYELFAEFVLEKNLDTSSNNNKLNEYIDIFVKFFKLCSLDLAKILQEAQTQFGFLHEDLDYRNCLISLKPEINLTIIDFGTSSINNDFRGFENCKDWAAWNRSSLNESYCTSTELLRSVFSVKELEKKDLIIKNCKKIHKILNSNPIIKKILEIIKKNCEYPLFSKMETIINELESS